MFHNDCSELEKLSRRSHDTKSGHRLRSSQARTKFVYMDFFCIRCDHGTANQWDAIFMNHNDCMHTDGRRPPVQYIIQNLEQQIYVLSH